MVSEFLQNRFRDFFETVQAVEWIPESGSNSTLRVLASDGELYAVPLLRGDSQSEPYSRAVCAAIAIQLGIPILSPRRVAIHDRLIPDGVPPLGRLVIGFQLPASRSIFSYLPAQVRRDVENMTDLVGWSLLDAWLGSRDPSGAVFDLGAAKERPSWTAHRATHRTSPAWTRWPELQTLLSDHFDHWIARSSVQFGGSPIPMIHRIRSLAETRGLLEKVVDQIPREMGAGVKPGPMLNHLRARSKTLSSMVAQGGIGTNCTNPDRPSSNARQRDGASAVKSGFRKQFGELWTR